MIQGTVGNRGTSFCLQEVHRSPKMPNMARARPTQVYQLSVGAKGEGKGRVVYPTEWPKAK